MNPNPVETLIREEIRKLGPITFARFMELALYAPGLGYYERSSAQIGKRGDFYTSVSVGPLFGELLAAQFSAWFTTLAQSKPAAADVVRIVEAGAHDGQLAADILSWFRQERPDQFQTFEYCLIEPSPRRRSTQETLLAEFSSRVRWIEDWAAVKAGSIRGVVFANELLDAMPIHRFGWDAARHQWFEWGVAIEGTAFVWAKVGAPIGGDSAPSGASQRLAFPQELLRVLPDQFVVEWSPAAESWWHAAARTLGDGWLMAIDYGFDSEEMLRPERVHGTLRAYRDHHVTANALADPGMQDLTAHVDFGRLRAIGEQCGLRTNAVCPQAEFLTRIVGTRGAMEDQAQHWPATKIRQFQTLVHPDFLGRAFRVLVQEKPLPPPATWLLLDPAGRLEG